MEETQGSRVQPRRSSRSTLSNSPTVKEEKSVSATESNTGNTSSTSTTSNSTITTATTTDTMNDTNTNPTLSPSTSSTTTTTITGADTTNDTTTTLTDTNDTTIENNDSDNNTSNNLTNHTNNNSNNNNNNSSNTNSNSNTNNHSRVTRSLSTDSNSNEESSNSNPPSNNGKRRRNTNHTKQANKKKPNTNTTTTTNSSSPSSTGAAKSPPRGSGDDFERETRNTTHRLSKEAKDARKAERDIIIKKKLAELDTLERTVKDQSHEEYHKLLEEIQSKRNKKLTVAQGRHALMETNFKNGFLAQKKSAYDKFHLDKLALRRTMMNQIQQKINRIEQEYFSSQQGAKSSLDDQHLNEWFPPDRPSMISSLTLGLDEQEINQDFTDLNEQGNIEDCHPLERTKKDSLPLMSST